MLTVERLKSFLSFYLGTLNSSVVFVSDFSFYTRRYLWDISIDINNSCIPLGSVFTSMDISHVFGMDVIDSDFFIQSRRLK